MLTPRVAPCCLVECQAGIREGAGGLGRVRREIRQYFRDLRGIRSSPPDRALRVLLRCRQGAMQPVLVGQEIRGGRKYCCNRQGFGRVQTGWEGLDGRAGGPTRSALRWGRVRPVWGSTGDPAVFQRFERHSFQQLRRAESYLIFRTPHQAAF